MATISDDPRWIRFAASNFARLDPDWTVTHSYTMTSADTPMMRMPLCFTAGTRITELSVTASNGHTQPTGTVTVCLVRFNLAGESPGVLWETVYGWYVPVLSGVPTEHVVSLPTEHTLDENHAYALQVETSNPNNDYIMVYGAGVKTSIRLL